MRVLIAGAGVGGLALALSLHERGIACTVFEAAREVRVLGVGINALPHAVAELAALGLLPALDAVAIRTRTLTYANRFGQEILSELRGMHAGHPVPQFSIHRGHLQAVLLQAVRERLGEGAVLTDHRLEQAGQDAEGVTARFATGAGPVEARGDILVGADGIPSALDRHHPLARRHGMAGLARRRQHDGRRRHEREAGPLPDRAGGDAGDAADQLGARHPPGRRLAAAAARGLVAPRPARGCAARPRTVPGA
jgi:2-polyprenyl-6-methoxyphenol hydroxylase-like FAD-dependent oxidoreductase